MALQYMIAMANKPVTADRDDEPIKEFVQEFSKSGGGSGVSLHFDAEMAEQYRLDSDTEVNVKVCEEDGDVYFRIDAIPAGFTAEKFKEFANTHEWREIDAQEYKDGEWHLTYRDHSGRVSIEMRSKSRIDGAPINNVIVESDPVVIDDDSLEQYSAFCTMAVRKGLDVKIKDSEGIWPQLGNSIDHDTDDAPEPETLEQLVNAVDTVTVQLISRHASIHTTLEDIATAVSDISDALKKFYNESECDGQDGPDDPGDDETRPVEFLGADTKEMNPESADEETRTATPDGD